MKAHCILIGLPDARLRERWTDALRARGYKVGETGRAFDLLRLAEIVESDVIVASYPFPTPDGTPLLRALRSASPDERENAPITRLAVAVLPEDAPLAEFQRARGDGADLVLTDGVSPSSLAAELSELIRRNRARLLR
ncbi:MAG: hypothetical protein ACRELD_12420 [Longimicrobiales bacterium]